MKGKVLVQGLVLLTCLMILSATNVLAQDFCQGDFDYDGNVSANDVTVFLENFGRSPFFNPCPPDGPAPIGHSGQRHSYATGDNADLGTGVAWPNPRFTDNLNDGTVTDNLTGLMWLMDANCFGLRTWLNALSDANGLSSGLCGLTDGSNAGEWRLPQIKELQSLLDFRNTNPSLPSGHPFTNVQLLAGYWSSTTFAAGSSAAWYVWMDDCYSYNAAKNAPYYVWPVRGGRVAGASDGSPCTQPLDCLSGYCADGVCCDALCDGLCVSCLASDTGALDGVCFLITGGTDPYDECVDQEVCDGFGGCANP